MDDDDMCDKKIDEINEIESMLYSKIHHDNSSKDNDDNSTKTINTEPIPEATNDNDQLNVNPIAAELKTSQDVRVSSVKTVNPNPHPKPFTPYTSYLAQIDSPLSVSDSSNLITVTKAESTTTTTSSTAEDNSKTQDKSLKKEKRMLNPFSQKNQEKRANVEKIHEKKQRADKNRQSKKSTAISIISVPSSNDELSEDDDVIILPSQPISVYTIDSSDDDDGDKQIKNDDDDETLKKENEPADDDYIGEVDLNRPSNDDALGGLDDFELNLLNKSVEEIVKKSDKSLVFIKPSPSIPSKSYEVTDNSFGAVDVYESESSDMPDTIYAAKQGTAISKSDSDSECSDIVIDTENRLKRFKKRKISSSTKESDHQDENSDDEDIEMSPIKSNLKNPTSCIVRGHALINAVTDIRKISKSKLKKRKNIDQSDQCQSDEEFISKLATIVHSEFNQKSNDETPTIPATKKSSKWTVTNQQENKTTTGPLKNDDNQINENISIELNISSDGNAILDRIPSESNANKTTIKKDKNLTNNIPTPSVVTKKSSEIDADKNSTTDNGDEVNCESNDQSVTSCSLGVDPEIGWNEEMKSFYNKSWGGENHDTSAIQRAMPNKAFEWVIISDDKYAEPIRVNRHLRCINCREIGHRTNDCNLPRKEVKCYMCGKPGHRETRCPSSMCLRCGAKTNLFLHSCNRCVNLKYEFCRLCKGRGHSAKFCADKWRRYHSTTEPNTDLIAYGLTNIKSQYKKFQFCSICAGKGHLAETCRNALKIMDFPVTPTDISSYRKTYGNTDISDKTTKDYVPYAMISSPKSNCQFNWDVDESPDRFYGRFMKSTNFNRSKPVRQKEQRDKHTKPNLVLNPMNAVSSSSSSPLSSKKRKTKNDKILKDVQAEITNDLCETKTNDDAHHPTEPHDVEFNLINALINDDIFYQDNIGALEEMIIAANENGNKLIDETIHINETICDADEKILNVSSESLVNFSFTKAIQELEEESKQKTSKEDPKPKTFDLSFINAKNCNTIPSSKRYSQKMMEQLLPSIKDKSNEIKPASTAISGTNYRTSSKTTTTATTATRHHSPDSNYSFSEFFSNDIDENDAEIIEREPIEKPRKIPVLGSSSSPPPPSIEPVTSSSSKYKWTQSNKKSIPLTYQKIPVIETRNNSIIKFDDDHKMPEYIPLVNHHHENDVRLSSHDIDHLPSTNNSSICSGISLQISENYPSSPLPEQKCDAKIYLTKDHSKYLSNEKGTEFLRDASLRNKVVVLMGYESIGNFLTVNGYPSNQNSFHTELIAYFKHAEKCMMEKKIISTRVPKARCTLIKFIKDQLLQLDRSLGNVQELYKSLKIFDKQNSKSGTNRADKCRKTLNMILLGQARLRDGEMHLFALQSNLQYLMTSSREIVSPNFRNQVFKHCRYIFSSFDHKEYDSLVKEYLLLKRNNQLPNVDLDRKLLGLKMNLKANEINDVGSDNDERKIPTPPAPTGLELQEAKKKLQLESKKDLTADNTSSSEIHLKKDKNIISKTLKKLSKPSSSSASSIDKNLSSMPNNSKDRSSSLIWSRKCLECIEKIHASSKLLNNVKEHNFDLDRLEKHAKDSKLSYAHYRLLLSLIANNK